MTPKPSGPALFLDNVVKTYGSIRAVDGVSFSVAPGEFVALLGPNGAGKTTLFQLLSGLFVPDSGQVEIMGQDMRRNPVPALAMLGIVFQQPALDLELSVSENLLFHAGLQGMRRSAAKERIAAELKRLGLAERAKDKTGQLSGGNRRRVELARALLHDPRVLLMDEATVGLDPASRSDLLKLMLTMRVERSVAVLWATHLCDEVSGADRVIVLHRGKVLADATPAHRAGIFGNDWTAIDRRYGCCGAVLVQQSGKGLAGSGAELCRTYGAVVIGIGGLEPLFDRGKIFVLSQGLVVVRIGGREVLSAQASLQLLDVERAVFVMIELVEEVACRLLGLGKVHRAVIIGVE
jgi:ABC-2 type transport system ATP-binding protein